MRFEKKLETACLKETGSEHYQLAFKGWVRAYKDFFVQCADVPDVCVINPCNSPTWSVCSHVSAQNRKTQSKFEGIECGYAENVDICAAISILRAEYARLACQVNDAVMS